MSVFGRVDRNAIQIYRLNHQEMLRTGTRILYTPRRRCTCLHPLTRQPDLGCRVCDGIGWYWLPCDERQILAVVQNGALHRDLVAQGIVLPGDLVIQFDRNPSGLGPWDRVRLNPHGLETFAIPGEDALVTRGQGDTDSLQYRLHKILSVSRTDPRTGMTIDYPETSYRARAFTNQIAWVADPCPPEGEQYAVSYLVDFDWVISEPTAPSALGPVGFQGRIPINRRFKDERHKEELAKDAPPQDLEEEW